MKIIITGASGNMGRALAEAFARTHQLVYISRRMPEGLPEGTHYMVDMIHAEPLAEIFTKEQPDVVIHLAAMIGPICDQEPELARKVNVDATRLLAELSVEHGVKNFVFPSTAATYNQSELTATDEDHNIGPRSMYGRTKLEAEEALAEVAKTGATHFVALRIFNLYGKGFDASLVNKLSASDLDNPIHLFGLETFYRDYIHIKDIVTVVANICKGVELPAFSVFNIASGKATNNLELIEQLRAQGYDPHFTVQEAEPSYSWADISRAEDMLDFAPSTAITM